MAKILIVDDDPDITFTTSLFLKKAQHEVLTASNRADGMQAIEEGNPDLIILDVMMDRYTEGFRVAQRLRDTAEDAEYAAYRGVPILVMTAVHRTTSFRFGPNETSLPVDAFLEKPVSADQLIATVAQLLSKAPAPQAR